MESSTKTSNESLHAQKQITPGDRACALPSDVSKPECALHPITGGDQSLWDSMREAHQSTLQNESLWDSTLSYGMDGMVISRDDMIGGFGMTSKLDYKVGDLIFSERPLVQDTANVLLHGIHQELHNDRREWCIVEEMVRSFDSETIKTLLTAGYATGLASILWEDGGDDIALNYIATTYCRKIAPTNVRPLYDIVVTNAIPSRLTLVMDKFVIVDAKGFFPFASRINHSCFPNIRMETPVSTQGPEQCLVVRFVALENIRAGDRLTVDYVSNTPLPKKRTRLLEQFGFRCKCARCAPLCDWIPCNVLGEMRCPCKRVYYCSSQHQKIDWQRHKREHTSPSPHSPHISSTSTSPSPTSSPHQQTPLE